MLAINICILRGVSVLVYLLWNSPLVIVFFFCCDVIQIQFRLFLKMIHPQQLTWCLMTMFGNVRWLHWPFSFINAWTHIHPPSFFELWNIKMTLKAFPGKFREWAVYEQRLLLDDNVFPLKIWHQWT